MKQTSLKEYIEDKLRDDTRDSNILYANSYIIRGEGYAVVCAVGSKTQHGIALSSNYSCKELDYSNLVGWRKLLQDFENQILYGAIVVCLIFAFEAILRNYKSPLDDKQNGLAVFMIMIVTMITMFMAMFTNYDSSRMWAITEAT